MVPSQAELHNNTTSQSIITPLLNLSIEGSHAMTVCTIVLWHWAIWCDHSPTSWCHVLGTVLLSISSWQLHFNLRLLIQQRFQMSCKTHSAVSELMWTSYTLSDLNFLSNFRITNNSSKYGILKRKVNIWIVHHNSSNSLIWTLLITSLPHTLPVRINQSHCVSSPILQTDHQTSLLKKQARSRSAWSSSTLTAWGVTSSIRNPIIVFRQHNAAPGRQQWHQWLHPPSLDTVHPSKSISTAQ